MTDQIERRAIRFPSTGHIWVPQRGHRAAAAGISMHSPRRPTRVLAQRALYLGVRVLGSRVVPGERSEWQPPLPETEWHHLLAAWRAVVGDFDSLVLYRRPQTGRTGFAALLLHAGRGSAFARFHPDAERIEREFACPPRSPRRGPKTFGVARPIAESAIKKGARGCSASPCPTIPLGAVRHPATRGRVADEISEVLAT